MRKLASLLLALVLVFGLATTAFATATSGTNNDTGKITISNAVKDQTYTVYQILELESYDTTGGSGAYAYKATATWKSFVESEAIKDKYLATDAQGYVTWVKDEDGNDADPAAFAKLAKAYAAANSSSISAQATKTATDTTVEFTGLNLGYYLVDSTLGTLCSLDTTNPSVTIREKNAVPTNDKKVEEDSTGAYGATNDADIGQDVNFKSTVTLPAGSENVVFKDQMSAGLTLKTGRIKVYTDAAMTTELASGNYTLNTTASSDYTFTIAFTQTYLDGLTASTTVYVGYTATLNDQAKVGLEGNPNNSWLDYGDKSNTTSTQKSETKTYTWDMKVLKYTKDGDNKKALEGVEFVLIKKVTVGSTTTEYVAQFDTNKKLKAWVAVSESTENNVITWPDGSVLTTDKSGNILVEGLDSDTYYLREIKALPGFNTLPEDKAVEIKGKTVKDGKDNYETITVDVENKSGTELPSTGGMGTTIFYILGSVLVLAAGVLLVTKKRMSAEN